MAMTVIWTGMTALSLFCALALGNQGGLAPAALLLSFTWENKKRTKEVLDYFEGVFAGREMPAWDGPYTRGHFRRGVK